MQSSDCLRRYWPSTAYLMLAGNAPSHMGLQPFFSFQTVEGLQSLEDTHIERLSPVRGRGLS